STPAHLSILPLHVALPIWIIALYARGMTVRDIRAHLEEIYDVDVSPDLISKVTDAVFEELEEWRNRPLDQVYPIVYIDALMVKIDQKSTRLNSSHVKISYA